MKKKADLGEELSFVEREHTLAREAAIKLEARFAEDRNPRPVRRRRTERGQEVENQQPQWMAILVYRARIELHYGTEVEIDDLKADLSESSPWMLGDPLQLSFKLPVVGGDLRIQMQDSFGDIEVTTLSKGGMVRRPRPPTKEHA